MWDDEQDQDRWLDTQLWSDDASVTLVVELLLHELKTQSDYKLVRGREQRLKAHLTVVLANLLKLYWDAGNEAWLIYGRGNSSYKIKNDIYNESLKIRAEYLREVADFLINKGYVDPRKGYTAQAFDARIPGYGQSSRMRPTDKLSKLIKAYGIQAHSVSSHKNANPIILKDQAKRYQKYKAIRKVRRMRAKLDRYNHLLSSVEITCNGKVWARQSLYRVFNNISWEQGGRYYGGYWLNIPKKDRKNIRIDKKQLIELDYQCLHLSMLYNREGYKCFDAKELYMGKESIVGKRCVPLRNKYWDYRKLVKKSLNVLLNTASGVEAIGAIKKNLDKDKSIKRPKQLDPKNLTDSIKQAHDPIAQWFHKSEGVKLQHIDSQIAEAVMQYFTKKGVVVLPVHDSFLMFPEYEEELREVMQREYQKKNGGMRVGIEKKF